MRIARRANIMNRMVIGAIRIVLIAAVFGGCAADPASRTSSGGNGPSEATGGNSMDSVGSAWFVERAAALGLDFVHFNGASGHFYYPELLPPGVGLLDYANDGDLDVFLVQGRMLGPNASVADALMPPTSASPPTGRLYRNDLEIGADGNRSWRFVDVTEQSGLTADGYGFGAAAGDIDNDGWVDLFVTSFESDRLFRNGGDGTFTAVSGGAGIEGRGAFGVSAAFVDYDRDGWLDLYVGNNVDYDLDDRTECPNTAGARDYCPPETYGGLPDRLYRNLGNGTFDDVTPTALRHTNTGGVSRATLGRFGPALGVATADYDGDGWLDIYVANDGTENLLWLNQRDGTLTDAALLSGAALSGLGTPEAGMGVDAGDFDDDGDEDLFMTHLTTEGNNLYVNNGSGMFQDESASSRLGPGSLPYTGWGSAWFDFDNDGRLDVMAVNGTVVAVDGRDDDPFPYGQRNRLFRNLGHGRFEDVTDRAGAVFELSEVSRGAAFGDVDNDGDIDVLVGNNSGPARLLVNTVGNRRHWLGLRLVGSTDDSPSGHGRDMLGARVAVIREGQPTRWRRARSDGSYASANDPRVLIGLGESTAAPNVEVRWPSGRTEAWDDVPIDRYTTLIEGQGRLLPEAAR